MSSISERCTVALDTFFYKLGYNCSKYYKRTIAAVVVLTLILETCGIFLLEEETRPQNLWVSQSTDSRKHYDYVTDTWNAAGSWSVFHLVELKNDVNGLSADVIQDMHRLHQEIMQINVTTDYDEFPGKWDFDRKCEKRGEFCIRTTVLDIYDGINGTLIDMLSDEMSLEYVNDEARYVDNSGETIVRETILGGVVESENGEISDARAILTNFVMFMDEVEDKEEEGGEIDPVQEEFEKQMGELMEDFNSEHFKIYYFTGYAWGEEFTKLLVSDISLIAITYFLIILYAAVNLGKRHSVRSGAGLALSAVCSVAFAWRASYGFASLFGVMVTPLHTTILFLLLALGVDDAFVICGEYQELLKEYAKGDTYDVHDLIGRTIQSAGQSIMLTSITDLLVFLLGATTVLPALSSYCIYAGLGVFFDFIFQTTFFVACLTIDHFRVHEDRYDCFCCFKRTSPDSNEDRCCYCCPREEPSYLPIIMKKVGEVVSNTIVATSVIVIAVACVGLGIYGLVDRDVEFDLIWFIPEDSVPYQYTIKQREYFNAPVRVGLYVKDIDYYSNQESMITLHNTAVNSEYLDIEWGFGDWHQDFLTYAASTLSANQLSATGNPKTIIGGEDLYYNTLRAWLDDENLGGEYDQNVLWNFETNRITGSKIDAEFGGQYVSSYGNERFDAMEDLRGDIADTAPTAFAFAYDFLYWEEFGIIKRELLRNVMIAMVVIVFVVFSLIQDKRAAASTMTAILFAIVDVAGFATFWGLTYNGVTTIYTLIALGLSVDYSIHIGYKFSTSFGTSGERLMETMESMGPPVLHGALSTLIAVMSLAGANSYIFQTFFKMFVLVGTLGAAHGLVVLPCILFLFGGDKHRDLEHGKEVEIHAVANSTSVI